MPSRSAAIVDRAYRVTQLRPVEQSACIKTNLKKIELANIYGAALVDRLTEDSPLYWIEGLTSMKIKE